MQFQVDGIYIIIIANCALKWQWGKRKNNVDAYVILCELSVRESGTTS